MNEVYVLLKLPVGERPKYYAGNQKNTKNIDDAKIFKEYWQAKAEIKKLMPNRYNLRAILIQEGEQG